MIGIVLVQAALAAQVALRVDSEQIRAGQTVRLDLQVVDASPKGVPRLEVPEGLQVAFKGQDWQALMLDFRSTSATTFSYELTALREGTYQLGPYTVSTAAGDLKTRPLEIKVEPRATTDGDTFTSDIGTDTAYVGQVLVYRLRFQTEKALIRGGSRWTRPSPPGFTAEPTVEGVTAEYRLEQDGKPLSVLELDFPLRASSPGKWSVTGGVLQTQYLVTDAGPRRRNPRGFDGFGAFGDARAEVYSAPPIPVEVKELPAEGRPADASGLVGRFTVAARASATESRVGETVTVEVVVEGDGALAGFSLPPLAADAFRVYDDQPVVEAGIDDGKYHAKATFKRAIVPHAPGELVIPPIEIAYFDPEAATWARTSTEPLRLQVAGEASKAAVKSFAEGGAPTGVDSLGEDILPVRTDASLSRRWPRALALAWMAPGAALLAFQAVAAFGRRKPTQATRQQGFDDLPTDPEARLAAIERIFRERVARRLGIAPDALRREDLAGLGAAAEEAETIYRALERRRYGGQDTTVSEERVRALVEGW